MSTYNITDDLKLGDRDGNFQAIDTDFHQDIARVVVHLDDDDHDYEPGIKLAHCIVALPGLIKALRDIRDNAAGDASLRAAYALREAGL